ncbi:MAG: Inner-membrane translocator [Acetothermia bacterium 64_32]|nr:MAG: Inner-membrane translocator [Acetothermia bacterium 64_32]HAF70560.1 ABC transporter permease [Candidatus Acetothermia bacterium]
MHFPSSLVLRARKRPEFGVFVGFLIVFTGFTFAAERFLTFDSIAGIITVAAELGIVTAGITFLMIAGEFDLSVGSVLGVSGMIFAITAAAGLPHIVGLLLALVAAAFIGLVNGLLVVRTGVPSFIITLGSMMLWRGVILAVTGGFPVRYWGDSGLLFALNGRFAEQLRMSAFWFLGVVVILAFILTRTRYGNWVFATGGGPQAARTLGIRIDRVKIINFMVSAVLAGLAGCIQFARFHSVDPTRGQGLELEAIAAAVIGGALMTGGYGSMIGAMLGALLVGMVRSGLVMAGAPSYWYQAFIGIVLIVASVVNIKLRRWALG